MLYCTDRNNAGKNPAGISEIGPNTNLFTYVVEPAVAMSGIYKTSERIHARQGVIKEIQHTDRGYYLIVEFDE